jgi:membrane protein YqaA with SNARE-associated domain
MDAFVDTLVQLLIDWGYVGLFISALLAGSIIPFSSETLNKCFKSHWCHFGIKEILEFGCHRI